MTNASEALVCANLIMAGMKKKAVDFIAEWNTLTLYLESQVRAEKGAK